MAERTMSAAVPIQNVGLDCRPSRTENYPSVCCSSVHANFWHKKCQQIGRSGSVRCAASAPPHSGRFFTCHVGCTHRSAVLPILREGAPFGLARACSRGPLAGRTVFSTIRLLNAGSVLLSYEPIIVVCILIISFGGD